MVRKAWARTTGGAPVAPRAVVLIGDPHVWPADFASSLTADGYAAGHLPELEAAGPDRRGGRRAGALRRRETLGASDLLILRRIRETSPQTGIVVVATSPTNPDLKLAFESGATAFLSWPASKDAVRQAVDSGGVARGAGFPGALMSKARSAPNRIWIDRAQPSARGSPDRPGRRRGSPYRAERSARIVEGLDHCRRTPAVHTSRSWRRTPPAGRLRFQSRKGPARRMSRTWCGPRVPVAVRSNRPGARARNGHGPPHVAGQGRKSPTRCAPAIRPHRPRNSTDMEDRSDGRGHPHAPRAGGARRSPGASRSPEASGAPSRDGRAPCAGRPPRRAIDGWPQPAEPGPGRRRAGDLFGLSRAARDHARATGPALRRHLHVPTLPPDAVFAPELSPEPSRAPRNRRAEGRAAGRRTDLGSPLVLAVVIVADLIRPGRDAPR